MPPERNPRHRLHPRYVFRLADDLFIVLRRTRKGFVLLTFEDTVGKLLRPKPSNLLVMEMSRLKPELSPPVDDEFFRLIWTNVYEIWQGSPVFGGQRLAAVFGHEVEIEGEEREPEEDDDDGDEMKS